MDDILHRIAQWQADGLIDDATAIRLRAAEGDRSRDSEPPQAPPERSIKPTSVASVFGPGVTIGEMFAYLGGAFLLGAYEASVARVAGGSGNPESAIIGGSAVAAVAFALLGWMLRSGDARRRRGAGVSFAIAMLEVGTAGFALGTEVGADFAAAGVIAATAALVAAGGFRVLHAALLTQFAFIIAITSVGGALLNWLEEVVVPAPGSGSFGEPSAQAGPDPALLAVVAAAWWIALAIIVGLIGLREAGSVDDDPAAGRRAALTRLIAGLIVVIGVANSVMRTDLLSTGDYGRVIAPWLGDVLVLVVAGVLVERALRRDASTFVYAAALGLMIALSDFNFSYLSTTTEVGLLIEGVILLAAGFAADRVRRRINRAPELVAEVAAA
jgi:hypothetical protein